MSMSDPWTLVSVHIPKTGGTSFSEVLRKGFGSGLLVDNGDRPLAHSRLDRRFAALAGSCRHAGKLVPYSCVHGHFLPVKYALARRVRFCIWLRDPVQRVVSRYYHYQRHGHNESQHLRWGLMPGLSLEEFVRLPQYHNSYSEYLWGFSLRRFEFIGVMERYQHEIARFTQIFDLDSEQQVRTNFNPNKAAGEGYQLDSALERLIRRNNSRDVAIYEHALEMAG